MKKDKTVINDGVRIDEILAVSPPETVQAWERVNLLGGSLKAEGWQIGDVSGRTLTELNEEYKRLAGILGSSKGFTIAILSSFLGLFVTMVLVFRISHTITAERTEAEKLLLFLLFLGCVFISALSGGFIIYIDARKKEKIRAAIRPINMILGYFRDSIRKLAMTKDFRSVDLGKVASIERATCFAMTFLHQDDYCWAIRPSTTYAHSAVEQAISVLKGHKDKFEIIWRSLTKDFCFVPPDHTYRQAFLDKARSRMIEAESKRQSGGSQKAQP
jgi:hypothetical protein